MKHQKTCTMFKVKHNLQQGCPTQTRRVYVLDTPDLQDYSHNSNSPTMSIIKFRTFEHFLKFLRKQNLTSNSGHVRNFPDGMATRQ